MTNINLLPWREALREEQKREFLFILVSVVVLAIVVLVVSHFGISHNIAVQKNRNNLLRGEINLLDKKILEIKNLQKLKQALVTRMDIIQELQMHRPRVVHLFDDIVVVLPKGIHLTEMLLKGDKVSLKGIAESNTSISSLMRNINRSKWLTKPVLSEIKAGDMAGQKISGFSLDSVLTDPKKLGKAQ